MFLFAAIACVIGLLLMTKTKAFPEPEEITAAVIFIALFTVNICAGAKDQEREAKIQIYEAKLLEAGLATSTPVILTTNFKLIEKPKGEAE